MVVILTPNTDTHLLALALARRLKVPLMEFAQEALFRPLGIDGAEWSAGHDGVPIGAAELRLTAPEMLRIGQMMRAGGSWQGRQVVPAAFVREATTRKIATDIPPRGRPELWGYGYLFWLSSIPATICRPTTRQVSAGNSSTSCLRSRWSW
jgi:CubicO group peptidase (beta-lactamase class C family)